MILPTSTIEKLCSERNEIAAYIDGEISPREEILLETHFAGCASCAAELNEQKKLLCALDFALDGEREIELPANFTKVVVANAESKVCGLRHPKERFDALFVCATLFLFVLLGLGSETESLLNAFVVFGEKILAVLGFTGHFVYDIGIGAAVIFRFLSYKFVSGSTAAYAFLIVLFLVSMLSLSQLISRFNRA